MTTAIAEVRLEHISPSPMNPRKTFCEGALAELADSIRSHGVLQPILLRYRREEGSGVVLQDGYEIIAGERRWRAAKLAGLESIPAQVRDIDDKTALELMVIENLQRNDLDPLEEADGYRQLHEKHGYTVDELAVKIGKSRRYVYARMQLLQLPKVALDFVRAGILKASTALLLVQVPAKDRAKAAREIACKDPRRAWRKEPMSFREAQQHIRQEYLTQLEKAPWKLEDADLVPEAGPCTTCPKRTSAQPDLWGEDHDRADACTDAGCYKMKKEAFTARAIEAARARGLPVLEGKEAKLALDRYQSPYVKLGDHCWEDPKGQTWRKLLGKEGLSEAAAAVVVGEDGVAHEVARRDKVMRVIREKHAWAKRAGSQANPDQSRRQLELKIRNEGARRAIEQVIPAVEAGKEPAGIWKLVAAGMIRETHHETQKQVCKRRGLEPKKQNGCIQVGAALKGALAAMNEAEARALAIELLIASVFDGSWQTTIEKDHPLREACAVYGVDLDAELAAARADMKAKKAKKKPAAKPKAKKRGGPKKPATSAAVAPPPVKKARGKGKSPAAKSRGKRARAKAAPAAREGAKQP